MADEVVFDMPPASAGFVKRGGWVVNALAADFNLTLVQAAGVVGNIAFESNQFRSLQEIAPTVEGSRGGYGWGQWTGPRRRSFEAFCAQNKLAPASDEANYDYLCEELDGPYNYVLNKLDAEMELERCVFVVGRYYEAPGGTTDAYLPGYDGRLKYAKVALAGARSDTPLELAAPPVTAAPAALADNSFLARLRALV